MNKIPYATMIALFLLSAPSSLAECIRLEGDEARRWGAEGCVQCDGVVTCPRRGPPPASGCSAGWMRSSTGRCIPVDSVECGNARGYCDSGEFCSRNGQWCLSNEVDCGSYVCDPGNYCGQNERCIARGRVDCGSYVCDSGDRCGRGGTYCVPSGGIDCGRFACPSGRECNYGSGGSHCLPRGTAERRTCLERIDRRTRDLSRDITLLANHIGNATDAASEVQEELEQWINKNERAREEAVAEAIDSLFDLANETLFVFGQWRRPPPNASRLRANVEDFARVMGISFRKLEMRNPRFLKYAKATIDGLKAESELKEAKSWNGYIHAIGSLTEALIGLAGPLAGKRLNYAKHLIAVGKADLNIWHADFYAYWVAVMTAYHFKKDLEIRDHELQDMAMWSQMLETAAREKRKLSDDRQYCPRVGN